MSREISARMQAAVDGFDSALADVQTIRMRAQRLEVPEVAPADPKEIAEAAAADDAPAELKAVAKAVNEGRISWQDVAEGKTEAAPEIRDLVTSGAQHVAEAVTAEEERKLAEAQRSRRPADDGDDEDFSQRTYGYDALG